MAPPWRLQAHEGWARGGQPQAGEVAEGHGGADGISVMSCVRAGQD